MHSLVFGASAPALPSRSATARLASFAVAVLLVGGSFALVGCGESGEKATDVVVQGSTTVLPIAEEAAQQFNAANADVNVLVSGMGSSAGIEGAASGTADIGTSSRDLKDTEADLGLTQTVIAHDGIAVIVHPENPVSQLTTTQLRAIFSGEITNWKQVGGDDVPIALINRDEASGTREAFSKMVMDDTRFDNGAVVLPGTGQVREVVTRTPGAIGYISVGFVEPRFVKSQVKALIIDAIHPTEANVANGTYPISRNLYFLTLGEPKGAALRFVEYVLSDEVQNGPVVEAGFVPASGGE